VSDFEGELYRLCLARCQEASKDPSEGAETLLIVINALATVIAALTFGKVTIADETARSAGDLLPDLVARRVHLFQPSLDGAPDPTGRPQ
jgi:hypothetical protein